jgi:organic radical activating enzyme
MEKQFIPITPIGVEKEALKMTVLNGQPEIFHSIQGEGRNLGQDVVFCRLSECSLACSWCDSPQSWCYTQSKANQHEDGVVYDRAENQTQVSIDSLVESVKSYDEPHIVITGGEPLLQQRVLPAFIKKLRNENPDFYVEIETNGTIRPNDEMAELVNQWNVSPKLSNSGDSERRRIKAKALQKFTELPNADFKFVVSSEQDVEEILTLLDEYEVPADRVFLMPLGRTREELAETEPLVKELAQTLNMNFSTREHINRWGDKRGV